MPIPGAPGAAVGEVLRHDSLARSAADWIAAHIISGDIKPGEKLTETSLAERMGISRSPVREALQALSRDGASPSSHAAAHASTPSTRKTRPTCTPAGSCSSRRASPWRQRHSPTPPPRSWTARSSA